MGSPDKALSMRAPKRHRGGAHLVDGVVLGSQMSARLDGVLEILKDDTPGVSLPGHPAQASLM